jgi:serine/threonine protein kinase
MHIERMNETIIHDVLFPLHFFSPSFQGKQFVIKQINMSQLSLSEKEGESDEALDSTSTMSAALMHYPLLFFILLGAVQEVKLLSELHHPFIVGYRESFLEGEMLNIVMNYCEVSNETASSAAGDVALQSSTILSPPRPTLLRLVYFREVI